LALDVASRCLPRRAAGRLHQLLLRDEAQPPHGGIERIAGRNQRTLWGQTECAMYQLGPLRPFCEGLLRAMEQRHELIGSWCWQRSRAAGPFDVGNRSAAQDAASPGRIQLTPAMTLRG
jgi:hypothetical protein